MFSVLTSSCERALTFLCFQPALGPELNEMGSGIGGGGRGFGGEICKYRDMNADTKTLISVDFVMPPLSLSGSRSLAGEEPQMVQGTKTVLQNIN